MTNVFVSQLISQAGKQGLNLLWRLPNLQHLISDARNYYHKARKQGWGQTGSYFHLQCPFMQREQGTACKLDALPQEICSRGRLDSDSDGYWEMRNARCKLKEREAQAGIKKELVLEPPIKAQPTKSQLSPPKPTYFTKTSPLSRVFLNTTSPELLGGPCWSDWGHRAGLKVLGRHGFSPCKCVSIKVGSDMSIQEWKMKEVAQDLGSRKQKREIFISWKMNC